MTLRDFKIDPDMKLIILDCSGRRLDLDSLSGDEEVIEYQKLTREVYITIENKVTGGQ